MEIDNVHHANELFMAADQKMITIGGGQLLDLNIYKLIVIITTHILVMVKLFGWMETFGMEKQKVVLHLTTHHCVKAVTLK